MFTYRTIRTGDRALVWQKNGDVTLVTGPRRFYLGSGQRVESLERHSAGPGQYLVVRFKDGRTEHVPGPASVWFHPVDHEAIDVQQALTLDANEAIVVYTQEGQAGEDRVTRRVVRGPSLFIPAANEWLHEFRWHGADPNDPRRKVPRALRFNKLRVIPDQMYYDVTDVRTADDALLTVKLMLFFELVNIDTMLDQTHDPVADFVNAVSADVIDFAAAVSFEQLKERTSALGELSTYRQLVGRADRIGYRINKVVYRGYQATPKLQSMHDGAIEARTRLRLEAETENQSQELADLQLQREAERALRRREMEEADLEHKNRMQRLAHEEQLRRQRLEHEESARRRQLDRERRTEAQRKANEVELVHLADTNRERLAFLQAMQGMQVDLTRYLVAQYQHPDRVIRIDGAGENGVARVRPQLHLHEVGG